MPKPRALTHEQERAAYAHYQRAPRRGCIAALARTYGLTWVGMKGVLDRMERGTGIKDSRESLKADINELFSKLAL
ncbi:MAG TPA: hypothetical protein VGO61_07010 [Steroidobacteraceae bacterium]|jgi:hypothetical protein|nr:hypothetical protein [Steroidobacteraceae bacterium]